MTHITVELTTAEVRALKQRTGKRRIDEALRSWIANADAGFTVAVLKKALAQSMQEEASGKGKTFKSGRSALQWLES